MKGAIALLFIVISVLLVNQAFAIEEDDQLVEQNLNEKRAGNCPGGGNCNGHGSCNNGVCQCNSGWQGSDCSISVKSLSSGVAASGQHVEARAWLFYTIPTVKGNGLVVTVNQTNNGDVDMYMLLGDIPTRTKYSYKDISSTSSFTLAIADPGNGIWYIGIYGYLATDFVIVATSSQNKCPAVNNCNGGNGVCIGNNTCRCNAGWGGADCGTKLNSVILGNQYSSSVNTGYWTYYTATITKNNNLRVAVTQISGDVDVYIKFGGSLPSQYNYDYRDASLLKNFTILMNEPALGNWIFGFYGYKSANFSFVITTNLECPSNCSNHGTCVGSACNCQSNFGGIFCQNMLTDMTLGVPVSGYVSDNSWNYYTFTSTSQNNLLVNGTELNSGDCDLYIREGAQPTKFDYDYRNIGVSNSFSILVPDATGSFNLGVYGFSSCLYRISLSISTACPGTPACSGHGTCSVDGICICNAGYAGPTCNGTANTLTNGATSTGSVNTNTWTYYQLNAVNTSFIDVEIKETNTTGFIWTYLSKGNQPDERNYDFANSDTVGKYHHLRANLGSQQSGTFYIGVLGNPYLVNGPASFSIAAWASPF